MTASTDATDTPGSSDAPDSTDDPGALGGSEAPDPATARAEARAASAASGWRLLPTTS